MRKYLFISILLVCFALKGNAQKIFDFNPICQQAYQEITKLKFENGQILIAKARIQNPQNQIPLLLESYIDFFTLFLNEDPSLFNKRYPLFLQRIKQVESADQNSPFYLYTISMMRVHRAAVAVKFGKIWDGGWDFRKAFILVKENSKKFPQFLPNQLIYGPLQAVIGTIPKGYQFIANLFGLKGSISEGMKTLKSFVNSNDPMAKLLMNESIFYYSYLVFHLENKKSEAMSFIQSKKLDLVNNHLHAYMAANLALNNKQSGLCKSIIQNRNQSAEYFDTPIWSFQLAYAHLYRLELAESIANFEQFISQFKGKFYVKDALHKLGWAYYLQGNQSKAEESRKWVLTKGDQIADADKQAYREAETGKWPNPLLLKARLLNDGGSQAEAMSLLVGKTENNFASVEEKLEFTYRVARIHDELGRTEEAIKAYLVAFKIGEFRKEHYAARALIQIGEIYEKKSQKAMAISYFQKSLDMGDHEFKNSLDQRAKAGIERCKGN